MASKHGFYRLFTAQTWVLSTSHCYLRHVFAMLEIVTEYVSLIRVGSLCKQFRCQLQSLNIESTTRRRADPPAVCSTLLLRHTNSSTPPASSLRMLSPNPQTPVMPQTSMRTDLLQALQVLTQLAVHAVCQDLRILAIHNVTLAIEEPSGNFVLSRILNNGNDTFEFLGSDFASSEQAIRYWQRL